MGMDDRLEDLDHSTDEPGKVDGGWGQFYPVGLHRLVVEDRVQDLDHLGRLGMNQLAVIPGHV